MKKDKSKIKSVAMDLETHVDRFDLEQQIMQCWGMVDDVKMFAEQGAPSDEFAALATVYDRKFMVLFDTFELMLRSGQFSSLNQPR